MITDGELHARLGAALRQQATAGPDVRTVDAGIRRGIRRDRQRRRAATGIGLLAVMAVPVVGLRLVDGSGEPRPAQVANSPSASTPDPRLVKICSSNAASTSNQAAAQTFSENGYTPGDAAELSQQWKSPCGASGAAIFAGEKLAAGQTLPIAPSGAYPSDAQAVRAFTDAGYTLDDGVALAQQWKSATLWEAKVTAGKKLAAGQALPITPGSAASDPP